MSQTNNCNYCRHKYAFKYPYRCWEDVAKFLYEAAVARMTPMTHLRFIYDNREFTIVASSDKINRLGSGGDLWVELVEPMTAQEAHDKGVGHWSYCWPRKNIDPGARAFKMFQAIKKVDTDADMDFKVLDYLGDGRYHHCGITSIVSGTEAEIYLSEAWSCDR